MCGGYGVVAGLVCTQRWSYNRGAFLVSIPLQYIGSKPMALRPSDTDTLDWSTTTAHIREC